MINWSDLLNDFGQRLLEKLGENPYYLPTGYNPILKALAEDANAFVATAKEIYGFSRKALSRAATICQMAVYDKRGGPEEDGERKGLRRHWYAWYKTDFAQPFARAIGDMNPNAQGILEMKDISWSARLSTTYADLVDNHGVTYHDLWVEDTSRMMKENWDILFGGCHIIIAVEKDSLLDDFIAAGKALGAKTVISGKGKSSKAAIEKCLRDHFGWRDGHAAFGDDAPLIILHISDHDYDGESVIGPTFAQQAKRYADVVLEARVGVKPEDVRSAGYDWEDRWYQVKTSNRGYIAWAEDKALFLATCEDCGHKWPVVSVRTNFEFFTAPHRCPDCGKGAEMLEVGVDTAHGFEVEAMKTRDYYSLIVDALLHVLPFDYIVKRLREECTADAYGAADRVAREVYENNPSYQALMEEFERLETIKDEFERRVRDELQRLGEPRIRDWENDDPDPTPRQFKGHVQTAGNFTGPWRPFDRGARTAKLADWLRFYASGTIEEFEAERIDW